jgi:hypothetical protein
MTGDRKSLVQLATLWERTSKAGNTYYSGFLGNAQVLLLCGEEITRDNGEIVQTWKLLVQERERPPQRREQPTRGESTWRAVRDHGDDR